MRNKMLAGLALGAAPLLAAIAQVGTTPNAQDATDANAAIPNETAIDAADNGMMVDDPGAVMSNDNDATDAALANSGDDAPPER